MVRENAIKLDENERKALKILREMLDEKDEVTLNEWRERFCEKQKTNKENADMLSGAIVQIAKAIDRLGNADAATPLGAIEALGVMVKQHGEAVERGLYELADAIRSLTA